MSCWYFIFIPVLWGVFLNCLVANIVVLDLAIFINIRHTSRYYRGKLSEERKKMKLLSVWEVNYIIFIYLTHK